MRAIVLRRESLRPHLIRPSCRRVAGERGASRDDARLAPFTASPPRARRFSTALAPQHSPTSGEIQWPIPQARKPTRFARGRLAPSLATTVVLEIGRAGTRNVDAGRDHHDRQSAARRASLDAILQDGQPELVMNALLDPRYHELVGSLPSSTFVEALSLLSPAYFIEPYRTVHRAVHPQSARLKGFKPLEAIFDDFAAGLARIVWTRRAAGNALGLAEYTHLLDCARSMGDARMADILWEDLNADGVTPDVRCYNHYMEAKIWDNAYVGREKYHLRVSPFAYRKRRFEYPSEGWQGYGTGGRSVRKEVLDIFKDMTGRGIEGDEASYVNVILASSRVGHTRGIKNVLKTVWNVDVDLLMRKGDDSKMPPVSEYGRSSSLHPTDRLLWAVAHALGTNNELHAALRAVGFLSRSYDVRVTETVWIELVERAFVLSRRRFGPDAERDGQGNVSWDLLSNMYRAMTSDRYDARPTMDIHRMLAKTAWDRARLSEFLTHMRAGYESLKATRQRRKTARLVVEEYLGGPFSPSVSSWEGLRLPDSSVLRSRGFADAVHAYDVLRLATAQQTLALERLARLLLIHHRWTGRDNPRWERTLLPRAVEEWRDFLPTSFVYRTRGGLVRFEGRTTWGHRNLRPHGNIPVRRSTADTQRDDEDGETEAEAGEEAPEMDDDFLWARFRKTLQAQNPTVDLDSLVPLNRLFWGVEETKQKNVNRGGFL
ncbi:hypothetical protein VTN02DRAFT_6046 [Thermoascus thermophilus]